MPKYRREVEERGCRYTTYEVEAEDKEDALDKIYDGEATIVSQRFKQHDGNELYFEEIE